MSGDRHAANVPGSATVPDRPRSSPAENKVSSGGAPIRAHRAESTLGTGRFFNLIWIGCFAF